MKRLWNEKHGNWHAELSATDEKNAFEGNRLNCAVQSLFSGGIMVGWEYGEVDKAVSKTKEYLELDSVIIFEAFFVHEGLLCLADVVIKDKGRITLIEAKSSNNPKVSQRDDFEHIQDAAFQAYVMKQCGYKPDEVKLLHANGECIWPNHDNLFKILDISEDVFLRFDEVELVSNRLLNDLNKSRCPQQKIGKFCKCVFWRS